MKRFDIPVTSDHIKKGLGISVSHCAIALAIKFATDSQNVIVGVGTAVIDDVGWDLSERVQEFIKIASNAYNYDTLPEPVILIADPESHTIR